MILWAWFGFVWFGLVWLIWFCFCLVGFWGDGVLCKCWSWFYVFIGVALVLVCKCWIFFVFCFVLWGGSKAIGVMSFGLVNCFF